MSKVLGIELGSTRIKSVLIDETGKVLAQGAYEWENVLVDGLWSYSLDSVEKGLQASYQDLVKNYGQPIRTLDAIGVSAMMHGYLAFDKDGELLAPFRTWRNINTSVASKELTETLGVNMPLRWSSTHYYQAVLNGEKHVGEVEYLTTLAGYVHTRLTGKKVLGIGDASGMFPIKDGDYDADMILKYNALLGKHGIHKDIYKLLPKVKKAGEDAGVLTIDGARYLDPTGTLEAGIPLCPPEGDAGTGMVSTNAVRVGTGNVSAGTSAFVMIVMDKPLKNAHEEIDVVATPTGKPVAMVHENNCTPEINAWVSLFHEVVSLSGGTISKGELYERLFLVSKDSDASTGNLYACNFLSGETIADVKDGRPFFLRKPDSLMNLANFMQVQIYSSLACLSLGMKLLADEGVRVESICGHGGFFKTEFVGQNAMSAVLNAPVAVMKNAGEGGAYGIALLALYRTIGEVSLEDFLDEIYKDNDTTTVMASDEEKQKFATFMNRYKLGLYVEKTAEEIL